MDQEVDVIVIVEEDIMVSVVSEVIDVFDEVYLIVVDEKNLNEGTICMKVYIKSYIQTSLFIFFLD